MHSMQAVADNSVTRTLALALITIGGRAYLAEYLGVRESLLQEWLDGERHPPTLIYVRALDLVANGPFTPPWGKERRGRPR
ncbi:MAG TPA: hypothetical protein VL199_16665 [Burkholderiales bacterium]|nr:hypothetical protein [Burkholderiales bacterium]